MVVRLKSHIKNIKEKHKAQLDEGGRCFSLDLQGINCKNVPLKVCVCVALLL